MELNYERHRKRAGGMKNEEGRNKKGETPSEAKRRYNRTYYEKHKDRVIAAQKAREAASKAAEEQRQAEIRRVRLSVLTLPVWTLCVSTRRRS